VQAAARELYEETGLRVPASDLGPVVHQRQTAFDFGGSSYRQSEEYFLLRAEVFDAAPTVPSELELVAVLGTRWWTREELRSTQERVYPEELVEVLERLGA
jgi:8-oxo-dGTP pyrophosphatase MutT (NUDIX family)